MPMVLVLALAGGEDTAGEKVCVCVVVACAAAIYQSCDLTG